MDARIVRAAWCGYDFANSAFATIALTAFGGPYFQGVLVGPDGMSLFGLRLDGAAAWGLAVSTAMALVTVSSPWLGALADRRGLKRALLALYTAAGVGATAALGLLGPGSGAAAWWTYVLAIACFEGAYVFYNAFLPDLAPPERLGRLSGLGWATGYAGGLLALACVLPLLPERYEAAEASEGARVYLVTAGWWALFSLPALLLLRDRPDATRAATPGPSLRATLRLLSTHRVVAVFLVAYLLYNDGIETVIEFTGIYTKEVLGFTPSDNVVLFLALNLIAAPGALLFGRLLDRIGGVRTLRITLLVWMLVVVGAALARTKAAFWPVAMLAAVVIGATQASSRALMARLGPRERAGELMGLLALSGKASAIVGPALYGLVAQVGADPTDPARGHRIAIVVIGALFVAAFFVLGRVREPAVLASTPAPREGSHP
ncbi:MAG: MFS transporter [Myxococcota bacterium]|nr:MFS transporter [Myxococcota bacterium]